MQVGLIGLGKMGSNLELNLADHGFEAAGYDAHLADGGKTIGELMQKLSALLRERRRKSSRSMIIRKLQ